MIKRYAEICASYPKIFPDRPVVFVCGEGWFRLIEKMCCDLQAAADAGQIEQPTIGDVKEKFGTMRVSIRAYEAEASAIVEAAEVAADRTCDQCGRSGRIRKNGWMAVRCDACALA
jgi:hypothetical protein